MKIAVVGTGYVGLVAGACFADTGNSVICVDSDPKKIDALKRGEIPIYEPGLDTLVERASAEGRIQFTTHTADAVRASEIIFMAVGTPPLPTGEPDLRYLKQATEEVAQAMTGYRLIVNKSTVPIGSHRVVADWMSPHTKHSFDVVSNPEFLKEGTAVDDFLKPDRVIIGTEKEEVYQKMAELYAPFVRQGNPVIWMDPVSAEMTKYACNSFLATRISFMNEMAALCDKVGGNIEAIRRGMGSDVRIGKHFLYAGVGYGGSCFPKDIQALLATGRREEIPLGVVAAAETANERQKKYMVEKIRGYFKGMLQGKVIALWGLAFKPNTDDMREAPAAVIIDELLRAGAIVRGFDPVAKETARVAIGDRITYCESAYDAIEGADALVLVTEWNEFRHPDFDRIKASLRHPVIFDGRNIYSPEELRRRGFSYFGVGRG
ncbi:MAG: UDP-glucose 6-dehydrogenase [Bdellovibrionales bacterium GWB1_55_8]|nr:MAG: UDP-glucose 6-dehydrogenase [Bdellovibrionales bacterium GWB1_55_8]